jgi:hypothetical protein
MSQIHQTFNSNKPQRNYIEYFKTYGEAEARYNEIDNAIFNQERVKNSPWTFYAVYPPEQTEGGMWSIEIEAKK